MTQFLYIVKTKQPSSCCLFYVKLTNLLKIRKNNLKIELNPHLSETVSKKFSACYGTTLWLKRTDHPDTDCLSASDKFALAR